MEDEMLFMLMLIASLLIPSMVRASTVPATRPSFAPVRISAEDLPVRELFDRITQQTGVALSPQNSQFWLDVNKLRAKHVEIGAPFWPALDAACRSAGMRAWIGSDDHRITIGYSDPISGVWNACPASSSDLVTIVVDQVTRQSRRDFRLKNADPQILTLWLHEYIDPRISAVQGWPVIRILQAVDERGSKYTLSDRSSSGSSDAPCLMSYSLSLRCPNPVGSSLTDLRGEARFLIVTKRKQLRMDDLAHFKPRTIMVMGIPITFEKFVQRDNVYDLVAWAEAPKRTDDQSFGGVRPVIDNMVHTMKLGPAGMIDSHERDTPQYRAMNPSLSGSSRSTRVDIRLSFLKTQKNAGPPATLIWDMPTEMDELNVPFEFHDIAIP